MGRQPGYGYAAAPAIAMDVFWTSKALSDLERLYEFLVVIDHEAADEIKNTAIYILRVWHTRKRR